MWEHLSRRVSRLLGKRAALLPPAATASPPPPTPCPTPHPLALDPKQWARRGTMTDRPRLGAAASHLWRPRLGAAAAHLWRTRIAAAAADLRRPPSGLAFVRSFGSAPIAYTSPRVYLDSENSWHPYDYVERWNPLVKIPNASVRLLGETVPVTQHYLTDEASALFHSLGHMLWRINSDGFSFARPLSVADLRVVKGAPYYLSGGPHDVLVRRYPMFIPRDNIRYSAACKQSINCDHYFCSLALKDMLVHCYGKDILNKVMDDLKAYFSAMEDSASAKGYPTLVNPVFLPLEFRSEAFLDVYDLIEGGTLSKSVLVALLENLPHHEDWDETVKKNVILKKWYEFPNAGYDTEKPRDFLSYFRHLYRHPCVYQYKTDVLGYSKRELLRLVHIKFPLILPDLYKKLWANRLLKTLRPHLFFRAPY